MLAAVPLKGASKTLAVSVTVTSVALARRTTTLSVSRVALARVFEPQAPAEAAFAGPLLRLVKFIVSELDHGDTLLRSPVVLADFENAILGGMLTRQPHSLSSLWTARAAAPSDAHVRKAEEFLTAHLGQPLRMSDIATEVGISLRSLQKAFVRQRGQTLTEFLRSARLELARKRLLAGLPGATVSSVALDCGFGHFGKFAGYYRAQFGETPSQTLARSLANGRHC